MEIWLIRHGTSTANLERRFQGQLDYPLAEQGRREAALLAQRICSLNIELLLSSDLLRAWETAQIIGRVGGLEPVRTSLLRECSWGLIEGMTMPEIRACFPTLHLERGNLKAGRFGGEHERKLLARTRVILKMLRRHRGSHRRVALISHGRLINALLAGCLGLRAIQRWPFAPAPASLSMVKYDPERGYYRLKLFNDRCHL